ncbi:DUF2202 domain-containing protein [Nocardioides sp.]|uniref:DUF2202 domain-containing protein n=1 Tax=Nocardioides sp. TaxID=35761 RepID=UPI003568C20D
MNTTTKVKIGAATTVAVVLAGLGLAATAQALRPADPATSTSVSSDRLSTTQVVAMYEEERLAGDVYDAFAEQYGTPIFTNIGNAEERHQDSVAGLLEDRGYDLASLPTTPGDYLTSGYDDLYEELLAQGSDSIEDAYLVGVRIEETDIEDLDGLLAQTTDAAETRVLTALRTGSEHHLAAFSGGEKGTSMGQGSGAGMQGMQGMQGMRGESGCDGQGGGHMGRGRG